MRIDELFWNDDNVDHLYHRHHVTVSEVEEIVFGIDGETAMYRVIRERDFYVLYG